MNKKGLFEGILIIKVFIVLVIIFLLYFALLQFAKEYKSPEQVEVISQKESSFNDIVLLNFLRTNVIVDGKNMRILDLIYWSVNNNDFNEFERIVKEKGNLFDFYQKNTCYKWNLLVKLMPNEDTLVSVKNLERIFTPPTYVSSVDVPLMDSSKYAKVVLYYEC